MRNRTFHKSDRQEGPCMLRWIRSSSFDSRTRLIESTIGNKIRTHWIANLEQAANAGQAVKLFSHGTPDADCF
jgi:hypothetical protein